MLLLLRRLRWLRRLGLGLVSGLGQLLPMLVCVLCAVSSAGFYSILLVAPLVQMMVPAAVAIAQPSVVLLLLLSLLAARMLHMAMMLLVLLLLCAVLLSA